MVDNRTRIAYNLNVRGSAGIGRQVRLRGVCEGVWVQVPSTAPLRVLVTDVTSTRFLMKSVINTRIKKARVSRAFFVVSKRMSKIALVFVLLFMN